jgi:peptidoglycan/xylan/chitin deacetylase (PgdA/CDA1 family)
VRLLKHFTANEEQLESFPFKRELSMESYLVENEGILTLDNDSYSDVTIVQEELTLKRGRSSKDTDGRIDILATYSSEYIGVVELKLGELNEIHLTQLEDYLEEKDQILDEYPDILDKSVSPKPKWIGVLVGSSINPELANKISSGYTTQCGVPIAALSIQRFKGSNGGVYVTTDVFFKDNATIRDTTKYIFNGSSYGKGRLALAVLKKYRIPATVFVSTGFLNGGRMWNDSVIEVVRNCSGEKLDLRQLNLGCYSLDSYPQRIAAAENILFSVKHLEPEVRIALVKEIEKRVSGLPDNLMLSDSQVCSLVRNGIAIGAHTVNHPILTSVSLEIARQEILGSKLHLEGLVQEGVDSFAYPNGRPTIDYGVEHRDMVKELGFLAAVSTHWGVSTSDSDRFQLPRFTPWDKQPLKFGIRLLDGYRRVDSLITSRI